MPNADAIRQRLQDAGILWKLGRVEGAFTLGLVALSGLSRLRYPIGSSHKVYFDKMREYHPNQISEIAEKERHRKTKKPLYDNEAFRCIVLDLIGDIITPGYPEGRKMKINIAFPFGESRENTNIESIFYEALRNCFVHESQLTPDIFFTDPTPQGEVVHLTHPTGLPKTWVVHLINAIGNSPEIRHGTS